MDEKLKFLCTTQQDNLQRAIDFLKFAEAKNGAAIAYSSALTLTFLQTQADLAALSNLDIIGLILCLLGGLVAARSFVPQLDPRIFTKRDEQTDSNLLFFGDVAKLSTAEYAKIFRRRYANIDILIDDISVQVAINSKIAADKMNHFTISLLFSVAGSVCLLIGLFSKLLS